MNKIEKILVAPGVYWVAIPDEYLYILCGCPADSVKHLMKTGKISIFDREVRSLESGSGSFNHPHGSVTSETGPNAILLSDLSVQNGDFANLAEFPVLQMLYRQGMILPNHPLLYKTTRL